MKKKCRQMDYSLIRKLTSLALLPSNMIDITFEELKLDLSNSDNKSFFKYFEKEWIKKVSIMFL